MALADDFDRIVLHYDGNNNDPDDIAAIPVAALFTVAAGREDDTTVFYGNNLSEKNDGAARANAMDNSGEFAASLGIETHDYQDGILDTTNKLIEILESGEKVLLIEGGPMEATYRAMEGIDPKFFDNITLISHSDWNERRAVKEIDTDGVNDGKIEARNWNDLKEDFPELTFVDIADQNGGPNNQQGFFNTNWTWMDSSEVSLIQQARDVMDVAGNRKKNDPSDAGMLFFALTGDETADAFDAQAFLENAAAITGETPAPQPEPEPEPVPEPEPAPEPEPDPEPAPEPAPAPPADGAMEFRAYIADAGSDELVIEVSDDAVIDDQFANDARLTLVIDQVEAEVESVKLFAGGRTQTENVTPYALFGDRSGDFKGGYTIDEGANEVRIVGYSEDKAKGDVVFDTTFTFFVDDIL